MSHQTDCFIQNNQRLNFIDWARGVAAFLVVFQHSFDKFSPSFSSWTIQYINFGAVGVTCFFLISGYVIAHTSLNKSLWVFLIQRFFRIFPLYWFLLGLSIFSAVYWQQPLNTELIIKDIFLVSTIRGSISYVFGSWTLIVELIFYTLFILRSRFFSVKNNWSVFCFFLLLFLSGVIFYGFLGIHISLGRRALLICTAFQATLWYEKNYINIEKKKEASLCLIILIFIFGYYFFFNVNGIFSSIYVVCNWLIGYFLFFIFLKIQSVKKMTAILNWMGKISYSVYLTQGLIINWIDFLKLPSIYYLCTIPLSYVFGQIFYVLIEQPGIKFGKNISKRSLRMSPTSAR